MSTILQTNFPDMKLLGRGKVRDIYEVEDKLLIVSTDRISAFDVILPNGVPGKGQVLTELSEFWFGLTKDIVNNHLITTNVDEMPQVCRQYKDVLSGRTMLVKKASPMPVECVVRGYITGSGLKDYNKTGEICGIKLPQGLREADKFQEPIFTPSTKAEIGLHDESISFSKMIEIVGEETANKLKNYTVEIYKKAADYALQRGIIIADTKFEFGLYNDEIILIDEVLTPDSSRFWYAGSYVAGKVQDSMDKQIVRNYLETLDWDKNPPAPTLPDNIVTEASNRYREIADALIK